jgi:hypothetical protein
MTDLETVYGEFLAFADKKAGEYGALEVAGVMLAQALSIYRSALDDEDFDKLVDTVSDSRKQVKKFEQRSLQ